ncbi:unnamed protein product [Schistocephalus solidus]|uniref:BPTI/Kunitz inhibitor domain-containing protein n=1 Tax=Schistocephalus solidus TaxID=70667 RepID=A0A183SSE7_SCHSO|nr:unnamed protein product [Schistocephalus solidus]
MVEGSEICNLLPDSGMCMGFMPRFYFDADAGTCQSFIYGGCGGNKNNFRTEQECLEACA